MDSHHSFVGVVDDDPRVLESFEELLAAGGYESLLFDSAEAFLDANGFEKVDCLISDIGMPAMSGWDLLRIVRTELPSLPVILIRAP
jgi:FixJ family two-component response regulator